MEVGQARSWLQLLLWSTSAYVRPKQATSLKLSGHIMFFLQPPNPVFFCWNPGLSDSTRCWYRFSNLEHRFQVKYFFVQINYITAMWILQYITVRIELKNKPKKKKTALKNARSLLRFPSRTEALRKFCCNSTWQLTNHSFIYSHIFWRTLWRMQKNNKSISTALKKKQFKQHNEIRILRERPGNNSKAGTKLERVMTIPAMQMMVLLAIW